jgi:hypothetical protein
MRAVEAYFLVISDLDHVHVIFPDTSGILLAFLEIIKITEVPEVWFSGSQQFFNAALCSSYPESSWIIAPRRGEVEEPCLPPLILQLLAKPHVCRLYQYVDRKKLIISCNIISLTRLN